MATPDDTRHDNEPDDSLVAAAGRLAFYPARAAARASRDRIEAAVEDWLTGPEGTRALDRILAGPLPEELARLVVKHRVLERMAAEIAESGDLERIADEALTSDRLADLARQAVRSDLTRQVIGELSTSPELRRLVAGQTTGLGNELAAGLRARARRLDQRADLRREPRAAGYAGVVSRAIALAVDAALISLIATGLSAMLTLIASLVGSLRPAWLVGLLLGAGWALLATGYFATCWSLTGQTLGMRLLHIRVQHAGATTLSVGRSLLRVLGLALAIIPCFAGFIPVLFDGRRRGLADWLAGTSVELDSPA
ncbi:MAG TPA: RDD family protein [Gaiellaceae bacterium]|nr:RDD family protein [Gaiellaceae bacterium]